MVCLSTDLVDGRTNNFVTVQGSVVQLSFLANDDAKGSKHGKTTVLYFGFTPSADVFVGGILWSWTKWTMRIKKSMMSWKGSFIVISTMRWNHLGKTKRIEETKGSGGTRKFLSKTHAKSRSMHHDDRTHEKRDQKKMRLANIIGKQVKPTDWSASQRVRRPWQMPWWQIRQRIGTVVDSKKDIKKYGH